MIVLQMRMLSSQLVRCQHDKAVVRGHVQEAGGSAGHLQGGCRAALSKRLAELVVAEPPQQGAQRAAVHAAPHPKGVPSDHALLNPKRFA